MIQNLYSSDLMQGDCGVEVYAYYFRECSEYSMKNYHSHNWMEIMYVVEGKCQIDIDEHHFTLKQNDYMFISSDVAHRMRVEEGVECKMLNVEFGYVKRDKPSIPIEAMMASDRCIREFIKTKNPYLMIKDCNEMIYILKALIHELTIEEDNDCLMQLLFIQLVIIMARQAVAEHAFFPYSDDHVRKAIHYINLQYDDDLTAEVIAEEVNVHPSYLFRIFKRHTGMTINEYISNIRIEKSKMLLKTTDMPLIDISCQVGFNSRQYFSYVFKKHTGVTPINFRKNTKKVNRWSV